MTWRANRQAFKNVGRAMRDRGVSDFIRSNTPDGTMIIPAVAADRLCDLVPHFNAGHGAIIYTRSKDVVDVITFQPGQVSTSPVEILGDTTIGSLVDEMDRLDKLPMVKNIASRARFTLAA